MHTCFWQANQVEQTSVAHPNPQVHALVDDTLEMVDLTPLAGTCVGEPGAPQNHK